MNKILESQQTPHILPSRVSYGASIVRIWEKIDGVIKAPHCIYITWPLKYLVQKGKIYHNLLVSNDPFAYCNNNRVSEVSYSFYGFSFCDPPLKWPLNKVQIGKHYVLGDSNYTLMFNIYVILCIDIAPFVKINSFHILDHALYCIANARIQGITRHDAQFGCMNKFNCHIERPYKWYVCNL